MCSDVIPKKGINCDTDVESNVSMPEDGIYQFIRRRKGLLYFENYRGVTLKFDLPELAKINLKKGMRFNFKFKE